jgi:small subunit ribosomal protein S1
MSASAAFAELLKQYDRQFKAGQIVKGTILEVRPKEVLVDIGGKSEGVVSASEFVEFEKVVVGDIIDVLIEKAEDKEGNVHLSKEKAEFQQNWDRIQSICNEGGNVTGKVKSIVKGGLIVNIGVEAFCPSSQVDIVPPKNLASFVGNAYEFKVVKLNPDRQNVVLSRREIIETERNARRSSLLSEMMPGDIRKGTVKNLTDFGAFIDINREKERVSLGLKQKLSNPWDNIESKYPVNAKVKGKIVNLVPYGAFVEIEPGVEGLVHVTELSWTKRIAKPSDVLKQGQEIEAVVLGINRDEQKISLGIRQLETNPWDLAHTKYPPGTKVKGPIRNLTSYGAFLELEEGLDGMVHVSDMSWTRKVNHPSEVLKKGDEVEAVVLEVDKANQRISLGMKQLGVDPWEQIETLFKVGDLVTGKVTKLASFGAFVGLPNDIDGLVHISQVSEDRVDKIKNVLKVGDDVTARVIKIDRADRRIGLSIKAANYSTEQLKEEQKLLDQLKPGEDLVALEHAFAAAEEKKTQD